MSRLLVFSDTHGAIDGMIPALLAAAGIDRFLHLGDYAEDARLLEDITHRNILGVRGNNDFWDRTVPLQRVVQLPEGRILMVHGHLQGVYAGTSELVALARQENCAMVVYGHTHRFDMREEQGVFCLNPGSTSLPRGDGRASYAIVEWENGEIPRVERVFLPLSPCVEKGFLHL